MAIAAEERPSHDGGFPTWPLWVLALPAGVAIWSGWVGLGQMSGFGPVEVLPGISDAKINSAMTLPIGMEAYSAYAIKAWLSHQVSSPARRFARISALFALGLGVLGQVFYHLMVAAGVSRAPWPVTAFVASLPVLVLGLGAALAHLINEEVRTEGMGAPTRGPSPEAHVGPSDADSSRLGTGPTATAVASNSEEGETVAASSDDAVDTASPRPERLTASLMTAGPGYEAIRSAQQASSQPDAGPHWDTQTPTEWTSNKPG